MINYAIEQFYNEMEVYYKTTLAQPIIHIHNHYEIYLIIEGEANFFLDDTFYDVQPGDLILIKDNQIHGPKPIGNEYIKRSYIHFSHKFAKALSSKHTNIIDLFETNSGIIRLDEQQFQHMKSLFMNIYNESQSPLKVGHDLIMESYITEILVHTYNYSLTQEDIEDNSSNNELSDLIKEAIYFIQNSIMDTNLSLEKIADHLSYNKTYVNRIFKNEVGTTIYQYILISRISLAKRMMKEGIPPTECYFECGFSNYSSFYRAFKKNTGILPSEYYNLIQE